MSSDVDAPAGKAAAGSRQALVSNLQHMSQMCAIKYEEHGVGGVTYIAEQLRLPSHLHVNVSQAPLMPKGRSSAIHATVL